VIAPWICHRCPVVCAVTNRRSLPQVAKDSVAASVVVLGIELTNPFPQKFCEVAWLAATMRRDAPGSTARRGRRRSGGATARQSSGLMSGIGEDAEDDAQIESFQLPGADLSAEELAVRVVPKKADEFVCSGCASWFTAARGWQQLRKG